MKVKPRGSYGIDAAYVPILWFIPGVMFASATLGTLGGSAWQPIVYGLLTIQFLGGTAIYLHTTLRGKFAVWRRILSETDDADVERILDLGCGRGAVIVMAAQRFPKAKLTGIDLWRKSDQSGNGEEAATANAKANGVNSRIDFVTGDMTALPFEDGSFDLVTASMSIHNIPKAEGRARAIREAVRVLKPGGRIVIADLKAMDAYADELSKLGLKVDGPKSLGWQTWWSGPWVSSKMLRAAAE